MRRSFSTVALRSCTVWKQSTSTKQSGMISKSFPSDMFLNCQNKFSSSNPKAFTEKGLYMLATILKSKQATATTLAIVEAFAKLRELSRAVAELSEAKDKSTQKSLMERNGEIMSELLYGDLEESDTETSLEINLAVMKFKHIVKRKKKIMEIQTNTDNFETKTAKTAWDYLLFTARTFLLLALVVNLTVTVVGYCILPDQIVSRANPDYEIGLRKPYTKEYFFGVVGGIIMWHVCLCCIDAVASYKKTRNDQCHQLLGSRGKCFFEEENHWFLAEHSY